MSAAVSRPVHEATRAWVVEHGLDAPRALYAAYERQNAEHFGGRLGLPLLWITQCSSPRSWGDYVGRDEHGLESRIRLAPKVVGRGLLLAEDVLLHEMVHAWQWEVHGDRELGYRGHGPAFAGECNRIGATLGLAAVAARPRGAKGQGKLDCAHWPFNVRPPGYYGEDFAAPKPKREPAPSAEDAPSSGPVRTESPLEHAARAWRRLDLEPLPLSTKAEGETRELELTPTRAEGFARA